jgi:hypothetical protein
MVKLHAGLVYEYVYRFAVNVYASSANGFRSALNVLAEFRRINSGHHAGTVQARRD